LQYSIQFPDLRDDDERRADLELKFSPFDEVYFRNEADGTCQIENRAENRYEEVEA
jgi:hypothetical protein